MQKVYLIFLSLVFFTLNFVQAQTYSIVIKGGHVIDPKNNLNGVMDVAILDGKIAQVGKNIDTKGAAQVVNAKGMYVTPGLIDIHSHNFFGTEPNHAYSNGFNALPPDGFTFRNGVTTVVDCGGAGWRSFPTFKQNVIDNSKTRVLSFLNIVGEGMRGGAYEQNTQDMDAKMTALVAKQHKNYIVGVKVAHYEGPEWTPVDRAVEAGNMANIPVIIDFGGSNPPLSIEELFMKHLRPGDIYTHAFGQLATREAIVDTASKKVKPFVWEAQKRGIIFDVGYGGISFAFSQAVPALKNGFYPNTISTDIHTGSMNNAMKDMLTTMSKFLIMGMELQPVIQASTWNSAKAIKREELGHLSVGALADVAVLTLRNGKFGYFDYTGYKLEGNKRLECEMTIRDGKIVYDLNGIASPLVVPQKPAAASR
ncbi:amidohydrolase/deacetylase family metallohydrolase [Rhodocytophaga aerolata]|uniref:Amidohydrolase/deacetylase family metallohydrolase n=1 Tax=Rhodocytophaga aerolata TaxID=455078 RepID=A0ABT8R0M6_9BACT|nr:amidohydrolase/deacetylase family metallohydrolase [Rhodocytophaga aerolata]MDO1444954.1 amidohydrolase/deacetylase family metallohydrolase [Rhodocytophaga aerolata]